MRCYYNNKKTCPSCVVDNRQSWQMVLRLSKLLGMSISVNCLSEFYYINFSMLFQFVATIVYGFSFLRTLFAFQMG